MQTYSAIHVFWPLHANIKITQYVRAVARQGYAAIGNQNIPKRSKALEGLPDIASCVGRSEIQFMLKRVATSKPNGVVGEICLVDESAIQSLSMSATTRICEITGEASPCNVELLQLSWAELSQDRRAIEG